MTAAYDIHPAAAFMPPMADGDYEALRDDIAASGLIHPLVLHGGRLLDGRHRQRACAELGIPPDTIALPETVEPYGYVVSVNVQRRHLSVAQRALIGAQMPREDRGRSANSKNHFAKLQSGVKLSQKERALAVGVSVRSLSSAEYVVDHAEPAVFHSVDTNEIALYDAETALKRIAKQTDDPEERAALQRRAHNRVVLTCTADTLNEAIDNMAMSDEAIKTNTAVGRGEIAMSEAHEDTAMMAQQRRAEHPSAQQFDAEQEQQPSPPPEIADQPEWEMLSDPRYMLTIIAAWAAEAGEWKLEDGCREIETWAEDPNLDAEDIAACREETRLVLSATEAIDRALESVLGEGSDDD